MAILAGGSNERYGSTTVTSLYVRNSLNLYSVTPSLKHSTIVRTITTYIMLKSTIVFQWAMYQRSSTHRYPFTRCFLIDCSYWSYSFLGYHYYREMVVNRALWCTHSSGNTSTLRTHASGSELSDNIAPTSTSHFSTIRQSNLKQHCCWGNQQKYV